MNSFNDFCEMLSPVQNKYVDLLRLKFKAIKENSSINTKFEEYTEYTLKSLFSIMIEAESNLNGLKHKIHSLSKLYCQDVFNMIDVNHRGFIVLEDVIFY